MAIQFTCPQCGQTYQLKPEMVGKSVRCKCGMSSIVQATQSAPSPPKSATNRSEASSNLVASSRASVGPNASRTSGQMRPGVAPVQPQSLVATKPSAAVPQAAVSGGTGLFGLSDDDWNQIHQKRKQQEEKAQQGAAPKQKTINPYMATAVAERAKRGEHGKATDQSKEMQTARNIMAFVGLLTIGVNLFYFLNVSEEVRMLGTGETAIVGAEKVEIFLRVIYALLIAAGSLFVVFAILINKFPLFSTLSGFLLYFFCNFTFYIVMFQFVGFMILLDAKSLVIKGFILASLGKAAIDGFNIHSFEAFNRRQDEDDD